MSDLDRRQFVKLTGVGAGAAVGAGTATGDSSVGAGVTPTESVEFVAVANGLGLGISTDDPTDQAIVVEEFDAPFSLTGEVHDGTWSSDQIVLDEGDLLDAADGTGDIDIDTDELLEDILDEEPEELVADLLENISVEEFLNQSDGDELFRIFADIIDALDLPAGTGEDLLNAIEEGSGLLELDIDIAPSFVEVIEDDEICVIPIIGPCFDLLGLGSGNADKLLAGDVSRNERANLWQELLEGLPDVVNEFAGLLDIPELPPLDDASDLVALGDFLLAALDTFGDGDVLSAEGLAELEAKLDALEDPSDEEISQAVRDVQTRTRDDTEDQTSDEAETQDEDDDSIIDELLEATSIAELDQIINDIADTIREEGFDALDDEEVSASEEADDTLDDILELLELEIVIEEIVGEYDPANGVMTAPLDSESVDIDIDGIGEVVDLLLEDLLGDDDDDGFLGDIDIDFDALVDELVDEIGDLDVIEIPDLEIELTTQQSNDAEGDFGISEDIGGGDVTLVDNAFVVGLDDILDDIEAMDLADTLDQIELTEFDLVDVIDGIDDDVWDDLTETINETLSDLDDGDGEFGDDAVGYLEDEVAAIDDFPTWLETIATNFGENTTTEELLADLADALAIETIEGPLITLVEDALTDEPGSHVIDLDFRVVFAPGPLPGQEDDPLDVHGEALFPDVTRSSEGATILDTQLLFEAINTGDTAEAENPILTNPLAFNFSTASPDDEVTILDVAAHWRNYVYES